MKSLVAASALACSLLFTSGVGAQNLEKKQFNVVGTWNFLSNWQLLEKPFLTENVPKASNGAITVNLKSVTELNLKGTELLRLLKQGVFDIAFANPIFVEDGGAIIEALDISGVAKDYAMARDIANIWLPEVQKVMAEKHNAIVLGTFVWPEQNFYCRDEMKSVADLKGKKVRVQGTSQSELVGALGGIGVTITFAEVVPALEKGVVDCGITGSMPAFKAKWPEVTTSLFRLPVGFTAGFTLANLSMWNKLPPATREFVQKQFKELEDLSWKTIIAETEEGINCTTGKGPCSVGTPGKLKLNMPAESDFNARNEVLNKVVLPSWAKRCGEACAAKWTELIGKKYGLVAKAN